MKMGWSVAERRTGARATLDWPPFSEGRLIAPRGHRCGLRGRFMSRHVRTANR
jgi:hypothetical protein